MEHKNKIITDSEADESIKSLKSGKVLPATEFLGLYSTGHTKADLANNDRHSSRITAAGLRLLKAIIEKPMLPSSNYVKLASISPNTLRKLRPVLIEKGFIREHLMQANRCGRCTRLWEPLELAREILDQNRNQCEG